VKRSEPVQHLRETGPGCNTPRKSRKSETMRAHRDHALERDVRTLGNRLGRTNVASAGVEVDVAFRLNVGPSRVNV